MIERSNTMKINGLTFFLSLAAACMTMLVVSSSGHAARTKGTVSVMVTEKTEVCSVLSEVFKDKGMEDCSVRGELDHLVAVSGPLPKRIKIGQAVILKVKGSKKIMGTVVDITENSAEPDKIATLVLKEGVQVIWHDDEGRICMIKTKKDFIPEKDAVVKMKVKTAVSRVEGC